MCKKIGFGIDRGGTFTDFFVVYPDGREETFKLLSEDSENYSDACMEGIRRTIENFTKQKIPKGTPIPTENIGWIRMGTTIATNALLERKGESTALLVTKGFKDLLLIGNQSRPKIFELNIQTPEPLYEMVSEIDERIFVEQPGCQMDIQGDRITTKNGQIVIAHKKINDSEVENALKKIKAKGINSLAILFMHSYLYPEHEIQAAKVARKLGFINISLSNEIIPMIKIVPRGYTACLDAYLTPVILTYVENFRRGFLNKLEGVLLEFMRSDGGLCPINDFIGSRAILSGPAGGVVGASLTSYDLTDKVPVIGFDMGGTSTDVSRYNGEFEHVFDSVISGFTVQSPQLNIITVAAGGGSRLFFRDGLFLVGPESAGSNPGPVCYRKNGYLTITDANVVLGRILPEFFPHIFGPDQSQPLDKSSSLAEFQKMTNTVNNYLNRGGRSSISVEDVALGFIKVANEIMCRPIRTLTEGKGYDTSRHVLSCFGGAGGQHACSIARNLGIRQVKIHKYAGVLSAYGIVLADVVVEQQEAFMQPLNEQTYSAISKRFEKLEAEGRRRLDTEGYGVGHNIHVQLILRMRYERTDCALTCSISADQKNQIELFKQNFQDRYQSEFGFTIPDRPIIVDDIRIRCIGRRHLQTKQTIEKREQLPDPLKTIKCVFEKHGELETKIYDLSKLHPDNSIMGPSIIIDKNGTILIEPNCRAIITNEGDILIDLLSEENNKNSISAPLHVDPIQLSIFSNRFMSIAEQMGSVLQRSAISTNIKERLDFSCALFDQSGGLVANAPHIPVHLGGMQFTVKHLIDHVGLGNFCPGDVFLSNHPKAGGSHLPDLTVITPVFFDNNFEIPDFFVANRGHHSDIGGLSPGSMPPNSTSLSQEGAMFIGFKIIDRNQFKENELIQHLMAPEKVPGCSKTRNLQDNISDLNAQVASNQKGIHLLRELVKEYSMPVVKAYMAHIQNNAEESVRSLLKKVAKENIRLSNIMEAEDYMDDGTVIKLTVEIDEEKGSAVFNFTGTGLQVFSNCNTPPAVLMAAIIYCLRCLVAQDIPLNQGCLGPIKTVVPEGCILNPDDDAAIVGGNVLTSQRICDVIFRAFDAAAASQGCMNNITFGDETFGYYETVAGGAGAGPSFHGRSGVHSHMTNTRITDPEILEFRYPVILQKFALRENSGGRGVFRGGDGVIRHIQFRRPLHLSVLTERRVFSPYGLHGGENGKRGQNVLNRKNRGRVNLGGKMSIDVFAGDIFELETPGGGGWGNYDAETA